MDLDHWSEAFAAYDCAAANISEEFSGLDIHNDARIHFEKSLG
jgi:hypothetical protein